MHGRGGEDRKRRRHMWSDYVPGTAATTEEPALPFPVPPPVSAAINSDHISPDFFLKDGRKFRVGDCALFQAGSSPPFIGIICWFTPGKEAYVKLGVTWLYRPSDIKLAKGVLLEAAPNEVFYSFHKDAISAKSLLHPCKVAFLRKGIELPSGISSFVCWRVYDITNKCLRWLTDTDYINEWQEEVDQLLDKTRLEMHAAVQAGGRSPKSLSGHLSAQQLKPSSDSIQSSNNSLPSQAKGKKRGERSDQGSELMKRERTSKADDVDPGIFRLDNMIKAEIAKITDRGGLTSNDAVEKLIQLMQLDKGEKKIDLAGRVLMADVIAATERNDCLVRFVQLRGVPLLDDWLQEVHKGKNGDGNSVTEGDKSVEDLLLSLLRALDKLPVNLNALQACHIGKSVNNLRSHKNTEIQKKARSLVDTWKKRVDAEMTKIEMAKLNDAKSIGSSQTVSWTGKSGLSEVPVGGIKRVPSNDLAVKGSTNPPSTFKSLPVKNGHGDSIAKSNLATAGSVKLPSTLPTLVGIGIRDSQGRLGTGSGTAELPVPITKDEKSSSFSQSQNNSQSCPSDHMKTVGFSWKDDVKITSAGSTNTSKISGGTSRQRRSSNGLVGTGAAGVQKDNGIGKYNSLVRSTTPEKILQSGLSVDRTLDLPVADHGNNHRLIVRLPNPGRSPARSASGGSLDELSVTGSRASSPGVSEKNEHTDNKTKVKNDICLVKSVVDVNTESCQSIDRQGVVGSGHAHKSPTALLDEHTISTDDSGKAMNSLNTGLSEPDSGKPSEASPNLIGACMRHEGDSESLPSDSTERLLPTVNADKMSKSELTPSCGSPRKSPATANPSALSEVRSKVSSDDVVSCFPGEPEDNNAKTDYEKFQSSAIPLQLQDDIKQNSPDLKTMSLGHGKCFVPSEETVSTRDHRDQYPVSATASGENSAPILTLENKLNDVVADGNVPLSNMPGDIKDDISEGNSADFVSDGLPDCQQMDASPSGENKSVDYVYEKDPEGNVPLTDENEIDHNNICGVKCEKESVEIPSCSPLDKQKAVDEGLHVVISIKRVPPVMEAYSEDTARNVDNGTATSVSLHPCLEAVDEPKKEKSDSMATKGQLEPSDDEKDHAGPAESLFDRVRSSMIAISHSIKEDSEKKVIKHQPLESGSHGEPPAMPANKSERSAKTLGSKLCGGGAGEIEVACPQDTPYGVIFHQSDSSTKLGFDLNEGFSVDDGNTAEPVAPCVPGCSPAVYSSNLTPFTVSPISNSLPSHITVASPAKGPFLPSEILLKSKGEGGWKGSAATSAFRRAEPRKLAEVSIGSSDGASAKQSHLPLNIDLNAPDETVLEDIASQSSAQQIDTKSVVLGNHDAPVRSSGGLDLDLNRLDESTESGHLSASTSRKREGTLLSVRPTSRGFPDWEANSLRDFDLNNGPGIEEVGMDQLSQGRHTKGSSVPFLPSLRMNGNETGILTSWFPPGNSYSAVAIPSFLPDRGDQPYPVVAASSTQMVLGSAVGGGGAFGGDLYRGPVLSSSPTMTFPPAAAFSYAGFPFGSSFPLASTSFSAGPATYIDPVSGGPFFPSIQTPLMGRPGAASSPYVRPNIISLPEGSTSGGAESNRKWSWQSLDLNAGPGSVDVEGREDRSSLASRQLPATSSQGFSGEQARIYQSAGGGLKRKEPEGGWDMERIPYKQHQWQ